MKKALFNLQYELDPTQPYTESGSAKGAKLSVNEIEDPAIKETVERLTQMGFKDTMRWLSQHSGTKGETMVLPLTCRTPEAISYRLGSLHPKLLCISRPLHTIERLDEFLYVANWELPEGAYVWCHSMTALLKRKLMLKRYPWGIGQIATGLDYLWNRVFPKLWLTRRLYFIITNGNVRTMSRVEILGRMYRAGFEVVDENFHDGEFFLTARKTKEPVDDKAPTGSPIIHLRRIGLGGKTIVVHKFRTMYTYSEYVQPYIYHYQSLERGGKFKDDYRVNFWGRILRRTWLDELPMLWNLLRGDMKLVGVRPLSRQYFNLYTPEMQELRTKTKPGMLPPFYYEAKTPETLDEVQESERRYLEAYLKKPFATDWRYFWGIIGNIVFKHKRSK